MQRGKKLTLVKYFTFFIITDFLVGSYLSSQVRLLKSRPVLDLVFKATTTPERIDVNTYNCPLPNSKSICLDLELTVSYQKLYSYFPPKLGK